MRHYLPRQEKKCSRFQVEQKLARMALSMSIITVIFEETLKSHYSGLLNYSYPV